MIIDIYLDVSQINPNTQYLVLTNLKTLQKSKVKIDGNTKSILLESWQLLLKYIPLFDKIYFLKVNQYQ